MQYHECEPALVTQLTVYLMPDFISQGAYLHNLHTTSKLSVYVIVCYGVFFEVGN